MRVKLYKLGYRVEDWEGTVLKKMADLKVKEEAEWEVTRDYEPKEVVSQSLSAYFYGACFLEADGVSQECGLQPEKATDAQTANRGACVVARTPWFRVEMVHTKLETSY